MLESTVFLIRGISASYPLLAPIVPQDSKLEAVAPVIFKLTTLAFSLTKDEPLNAVRKDFL